MSIPFFESPTVLTQFLIAVFMAIAFLQSGIDKVIDWKGNLGFISGHFAKSPLASFVPLLLAVLTFLELVAGALSGLGAALLVFEGTTEIALWGMLFSCISLICLFFGQRMAKDYVGAQTIVIYFILAAFGLSLY